MSHTKDGVGIPTQGDGNTTWVRDDAGDRVRDADTALAAGEHDHAGQSELDDLSTEVITANVAQSDEWIADGWKPSSSARNQLARDRQLLLEGQGSMTPNLDSS
jgi:hypothetical protein